MTRKNILLTTVGSAGDILPILGLGRELQQRGHRITVLYVPLLEKEIRAEGFDFIPVGTIEDVYEALNDPNLWHPVRGFEVIAKKAILKYMRPLYEALAQFNPDDSLVIASSLAFGARLAKEKLGHRLLTVHLQSSILLSAYDTAEIGGFRQPDWLPIAVRRAFLNLTHRFFIDPLLAPQLNRFRSELSLPPVHRVFAGWMNSPDGVLGLFPDWFAPPQPDWPPNMKTTGFIKFETGSQNLPEHISRFLDNGTPPIVFTAGSANIHGEKFFQTAVDSALELGKRAVLLTSFPEQLPSPLPESVVHAEWVPMSRLLQRAALIVHHGGIGTTAQALAAGIPQLVTPHAHDQFDNANRLVELGVAARIDPKWFNRRRAVSTLQHLLTDPQVKNAAQQYAPMVDFDGAVRKSADVVEGMVGG